MDQIGNKNRHLRPALAVRFPAWRVIRLLALTAAAVAAGAGVGSANPVLLCWGLGGVIIFWRDR